LGHAARAPWGGIFETVLWRRPETGPTSSPLTPTSSSILPMSWMTSLMRFLRFDNAWSEDVSLFRRQFSMNWRIGHCMAKDKNEIWREEQPGSARLLAPPVIATPRELVRKFFRR